jgi:cytochrome oxidase Cu insertion factor (SCO1/SenC/PrrC family)
VLDPTRALAPTPALGPAPAAGPTPALAPRRALGPILALGLLLAAATAARAADPWEALSLARPVGRLEAPRFVLPDLDGRPAALEGFRGRVVLLYFWTTW